MKSSTSGWPISPSPSLGKAIAGPAKGLALDEFPLTWTTWERWKRKHPNTLVLSRSTGFFRDYGRTGDPYGSYLERSKGYYDSGTLLFSPMHDDARLRPNPGAPQRERAEIMVGNGCVQADEHPQEKRDRDIWHGEIQRQMPPERNDADGPFPRSYW